VLLTNNQKELTMSTTDRKSTAKGARFTAAERAAMKERSRESSKPTGEPEVLAKIAEMQKSDRVIAEKVHALVRASAPELAPRTWYGMPAYANKEGKVVCHFQPAEKFKTRYATLGFSDRANLDDGDIWPVSVAINEMTSDVEAGITALVKRAVS
jgi:uncharacterized protein YdhG (YjbR/CyaY superfamily)